MKIYHERTDHHRKKIMILSGCILGVVLLAVGAAIFLIAGQNAFQVKKVPKPEDTLIEYMTYINTQDYTKCTACLVRKAKPI